MKQKTNETPEITVFDGYDVDEVMDTEDFMGEEPIGVEEVKIRFEQ